MKTNRFTNDLDNYGRVSIALHWLIAVMVICQFGVGMYMTDLNYYHPLYNLLPFVHKSIGVLFLLVLIFRIIWSWHNPQPRPEAGVKAWEHTLARVVQHSLNALLVAVVFVGYLLATAKGNAVAVFNWFDIPASGLSMPHQEDLAGRWHKQLAIAVMVLAGLHALAALKHHFIDRDRTLLKMLGRRSPPTEQITPSTDR